HEEILVSDVALGGVAAERIGARQAELRQRKVDIRGGSISLGQHLPELLCGLARLTGLEVRPFGKIDETQRCWKRSPAAEIKPGARAEREQQEAAQIVLVADARREPVVSKTRERGLAARSSFSR